MVSASVSSRTPSWYTSAFLAACSESGYFSGLPICCLRATPSERSTIPSILTSPGIVLGVVVTATVVVSAAFVVVAVVVTSEGITGSFVMIFARYS